MFEQQVLDLDDRHVLAAADDDVLDAAVDADVALIVDVGEIAGVEPTLGVERLHVRALVVAETHLRAAHHQGAGFADGRGRAVRPDHLDADAFERPAVGLGGLLERALRLRQRARQRFRHAPQRTDFQVEFAVGPLDQRGRNRRAGAKELAQLAPASAPLPRPPRTCRTRKVAAPAE